MLNLFLIKNKDEALGNYLDTLCAHKLFYVTFVHLEMHCEDKRDMVYYVGSQLILSRFDVQKKSLYFRYERKYYIQKI